MYSTITNEQSQSVIFLARAKSALILNMQNTQNNLYMAQLTRNTQKKLDILMKTGKAGGQLKKHDFSPESGNVENGNERKNATVDGPTCICPKRK